jgi:putative flippase GtrA
MKAFLKQFVTFISVGLINTITALAVILVLSELWGVNYMSANLAGYIIGLCIAFLLHRSITFKASEGKKIRQASLFFLIFLIGYLCQLLFLKFCIETLNLPNIPSQIMAVAMYVTISFYGNRYITFSEATKNN